MTDPTPERPEAREALRVFPGRKTMVDHYPMHEGEVVVRWRGGGMDPEAWGYIIEANIGGVIIEGSGNYGDSLDTATEAAKRLVAALAAPAPEPVDDEALQWMYAEYCASTHGMEPPSRFAAFVAGHRAARPDLTGPLVEGVARAMFESTVTVLADPTGYAPPQWSELEAKLRDQWLRVAGVAIDAIAGYRAAPARGEGLEAAMEAGANALEALYDLLDTDDELAEAQAHVAALRAALSEGGEGG